MTVKQFSDANETEYAVFMGEGGYLPVPHTLNTSEAAKIAAISDQLIVCEYNFTVAGMGLKSTKYMMTEFLYRNYETWYSLPLDDAGTFLDLMETVAAMPPPPRPALPDVDLDDVLPESYDQDDEEDDTDDNGL